jgi:hypothetical protein
MGKPANPTTVILKNKFYSQGLREVDVWMYYHQVKRQLIAENVGLQMMVYIMVEKNRPIIRRYSADNKPIYLDNKSYDDIITGRTISFHSSMNPQTRWAVIDIDIHPSDRLRDAKEATFNTYDYIMDKVPFIRSAQIRYSGKTSFHISCDFGRTMRADTIRFMLEKFLRQSPLAKVYTINAKKAAAGVPNLDLNRNAFKANHISLYSLSVWGLKCMEVGYNQLMNFDPRKAKI